MPINVNHTNELQNEAKKKEELRLEKKQLVEQLKKTDELKDQVKKDQDKSLVTRLLEDNSNVTKQSLVLGSVSQSGFLKEELSELLQDDVLAERLESALKEEEDREDKAILSTAAMKGKEAFLKPTQVRKHGVILTENEGGLSDEEAMLLAEDDASLSSTALMKKIKKKTQKSRAEAKSQLHQNLLKDYGATLSQFVGSQDVVHKDRLKQIKQTMLAEGLTEKQVQAVEFNVGQVVKQHYTYMIKQNLLHYYFSKADKSETLKGLTAQFSHKKMAEKLLSFSERGQLKQPVHTIMPSLGDEVRRDLENFLYDEASNLFVESSFKENSLEEYTKNLFKLQKVAIGAGIVIDEAALTKRVCNTIEDVGLEEFIVPQQVPTMSGSSMGSDSNTKKKQPLYVNQVEVLEDKLRHLYMLQALDPSLVERVDIFFKMKKLKNGLIKLGVTINEREESLKKEGVMLAQMKLMDQLMDTYREQATLPKLAGAPFALVKKKKAFAIKKLRQLEVKLTLPLLKKMQDKVNLDIYPVVQDQLRQLELVMAHRKTVHVTRSYKTLKGIAERLISETPALNLKSNSITIQSFMKTKISEAA
ncbi:hypothetical protein DID77_00020 [Candidatus Marinamargulisbacteria bacterium SCGC AG-439-L15]|nr:hypothetical protein DID77_00020 [Candidatus Marinamargulisbacteria bacterium SCGC AG-439-L15]